MTLWKRNLVGAAVAAAAVSVSTTFILHPYWQDYQRTVRPAHTAMADEPIDVDGQTWRVRNVSRSTERPGYGARLPEGTVLMNVVVERSGPPEAGFGCVGYLVEGERSWRVDGPPCGKATSMPWTAMIPASAEPTAIDIRDSSGSLLIRLQL
ncbi:hypothetical protein ASE48_30975 [Mycobacterium sp. Root265]|uniref:hypothetical protein n=1 Tax=Mycobacterium sp. Root265 TaxID=1736504 RepID=UPI00070E71FB|nr:hypothetical protein [Mycobacterium sp. Root265]KRD13093.1 hypothetical protein ASE48_30975 [Mycobacterium sp. Root265]